MLVISMSRRLSLALFMILFVVLPTSDPALVKVWTELLKISVAVQVALVLWSAICSTRVRALVIT
jgi:hypothetical protein